ncbi:MAG: hypothetical protein H6681_04030 [Desulfobacteraceae bacterium]|nr:hypothetical protein [Desulfobacteraceae bacterium]
MNLRNRKNLSFFLVVASGLLTEHLIWTIIIFKSNLEIAQKSKAILTHTDFFISPCCFAAKGLEYISTAIYSALFFTLTAGLFFIFAGIIAGFFYLKFKNIKSYLLFMYMIILIFTAFLLKNYSINLISSILCFVLTVKLKYKIYFSRIYILPLIFMALIPFLYKGDSFFSDFRDRILLTNFIGKSINNFYYKFTLYPAEIIKTPLQSQLKVFEIKGFTRDEENKINSILKKYNYFELKNHQMQKDIKLFKQNKNIIILSAGKKYVFDYKVFLSDYEKIFISISNKKEKNILKKTTLAGFLFFLPFLIFYTLISFFNFLFGFVPATKFIDILASLAFIIVVYLLFFPLTKTYFNQDLTLEQNLSAKNKFTRIEALKYAYNNKLKILIPEKCLNSSYDGERLWAVLNFNINNLDDLEKIIKKTKDKNINVRCKAYQKLGSVSPLNQRLYIKTSLFLKSDFKLIKDWYVQWYAFNFCKKILLK